jgi:hypothetical protein
MEELEPRPTMAVLWARGGSDKKGENQSFSVSATVSITAKLSQIGAGSQRYRNYGRKFDDSFELCGWARSATECSSHCFMTRIRAWTRFEHFVTMRLPFYNLISTTRRIRRIPHFGPQFATTTIKHSTRRTTFLSTPSQHVGHH